MPIMLDYYNNQKHITVSHLTALDRPKRPSYSADANLRCNVVTQSFSKMMFYQHRYFHLFSEKCISQEVSLIQCLTYSEKCIEAMRHHYVHWQVSQILNEEQAHRNETFQKTEITFLQANHFMGMRLLNNWTDSLMPMREDDYAKQYCQTTNKEKNMADLIKVREVGSKAHGKALAHARHILCV